MYVHLVWGTLRRQRLINVEAEAELFHTMLAKSLELGCVPCAVGGTDDHVHLLTRLHPSMPVARLVAQVKGASSYVMSHRPGASGRFLWQTGYGAFTISSEEVPCVERYVLNQKMHHANNALEPNLESGGG